MICLPYEFFFLSYFQAVMKGRYICCYLQFACIHVLPGLLNIEAGTKHFADIYLLIYILIYLCIYFGFYLFKGNQQH